jgi:sugar diacid utilization regulator
MDIQDSDIINYSSSLGRAGLKLSKAKKPDQKATTEEQMRLSVRLFDIDSLIRKSQRK